MGSHQQFSKSDRRSAIFNCRATTTLRTKVSTSKHGHELMDLVTPRIDDLSDSDKSSRDSEEKDFGQFIFTTLRDTVFSDPSNSLEWLAQDGQEDEKYCERTELWRENFTFDTSVEVRGDRKLGDVTSSYPRLQSSFYRELRKKYPIAFQRIPGDEGDTPSKGEQISEYGVHVTESHEGATTTASPPASEDGGLWKCDARDKTGVKHAPISVREKLQANSRSVDSLLYEDMPFKNSKTGGSRLFKSEEKQRRLLVEEAEVLNGSLKDSSTATDLRERIAQNNAQLRMYRSKLEHSIKLSEKTGKTDRLTVKADVHDVDKHMEKKAITKTQKRKDAQKSSPGTGGNSDVVSLESPPDSAIDMDSASLQSIMSGLTDPGHSNHFILPSVENLDPIIDAQWESDLGHLEGLSDSGDKRRGLILEMHPLTKEILENGLKEQVHVPFSHQSLPDLASSNSGDNGKAKQGKSSVQERRHVNLVRELELERLSAELSRNCSQFPVDDDDELLLSLTTDLLSPQTVKPPTVLADYIDDTDPRLAVPKPPENLELERQIARRYRLKKAMKARLRSTLPRPKCFSSHVKDQVAQSESESDMAFAGQGSELSNIESESKYGGETSDQANCDIQTENESNSGVQRLNIASPQELEENIDVYPDIDSKVSGEDDKQIVLLDNEHQRSKPDKLLPGDAMTPVSQVAESVTTGSAAPFTNSNLPSSIANSFQHHPGDEDLAHSLDSETATREMEIQTNSEKYDETRLSPVMANVGHLHVRENSVESNGSQATVSSADRLPGLEERESFESPKKTGILHHHSSVEKKLTPYEMSVCVDRLSPKKDGDLGKIYSAKQIHIDKSDCEIGGEEANGSIQSQPPKELQYRNGEMVNGMFEHGTSNKVDNCADKSHSVGDNLVLTSAIPPVHYRKRTSTEVEQQRRQKSAMPKRISNAENGTNLEKGGNRLRASNPCLVSASSQINHVEGNKYNQRINLQSTKGLSGSKASLFNSAKARIQSLRKAKSMDQLHQPDEETDKENRRNSALMMPTHHHGDLPPPPPPPSRVKKSMSFKSLLNFGKKPKHGSHVSKSSRGNTPVSFIKKLRKSSSVQNVGVDTPTHPRAIGRLIELKPDGTQTVELIRPPHGPFGIYIARATAQYNYSVFVTRFSDGHPEKLFAGLLSVGDEILEINDSSVKNLSLDEVYNLMGSTNTMVLRTVPVWCREQYTPHR